MIAKACNTPLSNCWASCCHGVSPIGGWPGRYQQGQFYLHRQNVRQLQEDSGLVLARDQLVVPRLIVGSLY